MKRELKRDHYKGIDLLCSSVTEPIPMKRELKQKLRRRIKTLREVTEPIPMKRELKRGVRTYGSLLLICNRADPDEEGTETETILWQDIIPIL